MRRRLDPAFAGGKAADELRVTSVPTDRRPRQKCTAKSNALPQARQIGGPVLGLAAAAAVAVPASASASTASYASPVVGHVYVNDNTKGANTIAAFDRHADGALTPVAGSPFAAGGAGTGAGLASQGAIQITPGRPVPDRRRRRQQPGLGAADRPGRLAGARARRGGLLRRRPPVSIAVHGGLVYVANAGAVGANYTGFRLGFSVSCARSPARPSRCPPTPSPVTCCSTAIGTKLAGTGWAPRRSTASPSASAGG